MRHAYLAKIRAVGNDGLPKAGYELYFYESGSSSVFKDTYDSEAKSSTNTNPVVSDANGWFNPIVLDGGAYNVVYRDASSNLIWAEDPVTDIDTIVNALISASSSGAPQSVQKSEWTYGVASGTGEAISLVLDPVPAAYTDGMRIQCRGFTGANTSTAPTINVNSLGAKTIKKGNADALLVGDIAGSDHTINLIFNSTDDSFILQNPAKGYFPTFAAGGTADALTVTNTGTDLADGLEIYVRPTAANTGAATLNYNAGGALAIENSKGGALVAGDINSTDHLLHLVYRASDTTWRLLNAQAAQRSKQQFIDGCEMALDADAEHDIEVQTGTFTAETTQLEFTLSSVLTKKIDAVWAEGDDAGGFPSAGGSGLALAANTWYYFFMIAKADGTVDAGFDTNSNASVLLNADNAGGSSYVYYKSIGAVYTDGSSNIKGFYYVPEIGLGKCFLDFSASVAGGFPKPLHTDVLTQVDIIGAGGEGNTGGSAGGNTTFDTFVGIGGGGGAGSSGPAGNGGGVTISSLSAVDACRAGATGEDSQNGSGGEPGITAGGDLTVEILGGTGGAVNAGVYGGGGAGSGTGYGGGGGGWVRLKSYTVGATTTLTIGAGGTGAPGGADGGDGRIFIRI